MDIRRRLPPWMMGQNPQAKDLIDNNDDGDGGGGDNDSVSKQFDDVNGKSTKAKRQRSNASEKNSNRKSGGDEEEGEKLSLTSVSVLHRCEEIKKRGKRKLNVGEEDCDDGNGEILMEKKKRKRRSNVGEDDCDDGNDEIPMEKRKGKRKLNVGEDDYDNANGEIPMDKKKGRVRKRREVKVDKRRIGGNDKEEIRDCMGTSDGDDDLTMEDLMSIAEEYVKEDKEVGQKRSSSKGDLSMDDLMSIAKEFVKEDTDVKGDHLLKDEQIAERKIQDNQRLSNREEDRERFLIENVTNEETISKPIMSGDPTQDMLDLFLGPLLKKKPDEEKKFNVITRDTSFLHEVHKQKQSVSPAKEAIPLTKKKSSLKDKVALLLD